ncbi:MAG: hypothetical protein MN733_30500 [Nitrososphaera sp.]|nr:hypothetical protein [Nitrososphaera sp.]
MSETEASDQEVVEQLSATETETVETTEPVVSEEPAYVLSDHAQRYYGEVAQEFPEELRPKLEQALRKWDAGFTLKAQEWAEQRKQFEDLGTVEELQQAAHLRRLAQSDPLTLYTWLQDRLSEAGQLPKAQAQVELEEEADPYADRFGQVNQFQNQVTQILLAMNQRLEELQKGGSVESENAALDGKLALVKTANPDVDIDFVRNQVQNSGRTIDEAVQLYQTVHQQVVNKLGKQTQTPPVVSGSGAPPTLNKDIADLSDDQHDDLVVQYLKTLHQQEE